MTHVSRKRFRLAALGGAIVMGLGLVSATAVSASAGVTPSPTPSVSVTPVPAPTPTHRARFRLRPEAFILHVSTADPGSVFATGPVRGRGSDVETSPTDATWNLTGPVGMFHVFHSPLGTPVVDAGSCTARLDQLGRFVVVGPRAFAFGTFRLREVVILQRGIFGRCLVRSRPQWFDIQVLGVGRGASLRLHEHAPQFGPALMPAV
jgi:hypothetical protein